MRRLNDKSLGTISKRYIFAKRWIQNIGKQPRKFALFAQMAKLRYTEVEIMILFDISI